MSWERALVLDPGTSQTGWVLIGKGCTLLAFGKDPNEHVLGMCAAGCVASESLWFDALVCEFPAPRGQLAGRDLFETIYWVGRFEEASGMTMSRVDRKDVKMALCDSSTAKDKNIRQALIDRWGGKERAVGKKADPGPLYGVSGDVWAALGVAVTWFQGSDRSGP